jgi:carbonic anhydrase
VRSSANINAGAKTKMSAIIHGIILLVCVLFLSKWINYIPLASLAAILILVGYKLTSFELLKSVYRLGIQQYLPFIITVISILFTDLLTGMAIGIAISLFFILKANFQNNYKLVQEDTGEIQSKKLILAEDVSFLNRASIQHLLYNYPKNSTLIVDGTNCKSIDFDVLEILQEFKNHVATERNIAITFINIPELTIKTHTH